MSQFDTAPQASWSTVRPFPIDIPDAALVDLRLRVTAPLWPDRETGQ